MCNSGFKDLNSPALSTKEGGAEGQISTSRMDPLPGGGGGGGTSPLPGSFPAVSGDTSSPSGVTQQQQTSRRSTSSEEAQGLQSHRRSEGHLIAGLLQPPLSGTQARWIFPSNHRPEEVKSISGHTFFQN